MVARARGVQLSTFGLQSSSCLADLGCKPDFLGPCDQEPSLVGDSKVRHAGAFMDRRSAIQ